MSAEAINYVLSKYSVGTEEFRIYYDFESYSGSHVLSQPSASPLYSGQVYGNFSTFTGDSGSGNFSGGYVKINNASSGLNSGSSGDCTFIFSTKKGNANEGVVFTNFVNTGNFLDYFAPTSGWEIGFNGANKIYFRNYDMLTPTIYSLNSIPSAENIYALTLAEGNIQISHYNPFNQEFAVRDFNSNANFIRPSYDWYLGTGTHSFQGHIDEFMYFSTALGGEVLAELCSAIFQTTTVSPAVSGSYSTLVTGYDTVPTGETGILYYTGVLSGTIPISGSGTTPTGHGEVGSVGIGDLYYELISSTTGFLDPNYPFYLDQYSGVLAISPGTQVLSLETGTSGFMVTGEIEVYTSSGVTGVLSTGTGYSPLSGIAYYEATGAFTGLENHTIHKYLPDAVYYIGERVPENDTGVNDMVEYISGVSPRATNHLASLGFNNKFGVNTYFIESGSGLALFLNGIQQVEGTADVTYDQYYEPIYNVNSGDFFQSGAAAFQNTFQSTSPIFTVDQVLYDVGQTGLKGQLTITGSGQYSGSAFSEISPDNTQVFLNGQKIYSGMDYISTGGLFWPTGYITSGGITGIFSTLPVQEGQGSITGLNKYDHTFDQPYPLDSLIYYINGVRQNPDEFIQHSANVDLIESGVNIMEGITTLVYNINGGIGIEYSSGEYWDG
jgi:hypothetical protein